MKVWVSCGRAVAESNGGIEIIVLETAENA
jgi:hypothetical protein